MFNKQCLCQNVDWCQWIIADPAALKHNIVCSRKVNQVLPWIGEGFYYALYVPSLGRELQIMMFMCHRLEQNYKLSRRLIIQLYWDWLPQTCQRCSRFHRGCRAWSGGTRGRWRSRWASTPCASPTLWPTDSPCKDPRVRFNLNQVSLGNKNHPHLDIM